MKDIGSPEGIRTLVAGLRSQSPRPLDDGAISFLLSFRSSFAGVPGLEPRQAEPESAGLPITPYPTELQSIACVLLIKCRTKTLH